MDEFKNTIDINLSLIDADRKELLYLLGLITPRIIDDCSVVKLIGSNVATYIKVYKRIFGMSSEIATISCIYIPSSRNPDKLRTSDNTIDEFEMRLTSTSYETVGNFPCECVNASIIVVSILLAIMYLWLYRPDEQDTITM